MGQFHSKIAGVTSKNPDGSNRQKYIRAYCRVGMPLILKREPQNQYDANAIGLWAQAKAFIFFKADVQIGYLNSDVAAEISRHLDKGGKVDVTISDITGGTSDKSSVGVNILINKYA